MGDLSTTNLTGSLVGAPVLAIESATQTIQAPSIVASLPTRFRRAAVRKNRTWALPRSFAGFKAADPSLSVRGAAPKCILVSEHDPNLWYMAKSAEKWGVQEVYTELFINQLGERLEFPMAHNGIALIDGEYRFISRNFLAPGQKLVHGSILLESFFSYNLDQVGKKPWDEQRTYDIELLEELIRHVCGDDHAAVMERLIEMLVFDTLIGSNDRHMQNWGIITTATEPQSFKFAPIFDSARALLWDYDEGKLGRLSCNSHALEGYCNRARPKIGCVKLGKAVNHFELLKYLLKLYPAHCSQAVTRVTPENVGIASRIMRECPFRSVFSPLRKEAINKILQIRAKRIQAVFVERGEDCV
jgi:hypothetical protein